MNPWGIIAWIVLTLLAGLGLAILVNLGKSIYQESRMASLDRRAQAGKVTCQRLDGMRCSNIATRKTTTGYFCNEHDHCRQAQGYGSFSISAPLAYTLERR